VLYAKKDATDQLRNIRRVSIIKLERDRLEDIYLVTATAQSVDGRQDSSIGAVNIAGLRGDALANALMKAETKAKRRVTLSICGLGILDETELETIPASRVMVVKNAVEDGHDTAPDDGHTDSGHDTSPDDCGAAESFDQLTMAREERAQESGDALITPAQIKLLHVLVDKLYPDAESRNKLYIPWLKGNWRVESSKDLTSKQASQAIDMLTKLAES